MTPQTHVEETVTVDATAIDAYDAIADLDRMSDFSPECVGVTARRGGPARENDRFAGHNRRGVRRWTTYCTVVDAVPGERFVFRCGALGMPIALWSYRFEETEPGRTVVTETWQDLRGPLMKTIAVIVSGIRDRATHNRASMRTTLDNLKAHLEG